MVLVDIAFIKMLFDNYMYLLTREACQAGDAVATQSLDLISGVKELMHVQNVKCHDDSASTP